MLISQSRESYVPGKRFKRRGKLLLCTNCDCHRGILDYFAVLPWSAFSIATWSGGATILSLGLTVGQAMAAVVGAANFRCIRCQGRTDTSTHDYQAVAYVLKAVSFHLCRPRYAIRA